MVRDRTLGLLDRPALSVGAWRRLAKCLIGAALLTVAAAPATSHTGPATVTIPSTGGYQMCLDNIATGDVFHYFTAISGTRHPYRAAAYHADDSVGGSSGPISDNSWYSWNELSQPTLGNIRRVRIDNQAASSGNGTYQCVSEAA